MNKKKGGYHREISDSECGEIENHVLTDSHASGCQKGICGGAVGFKKQLSMGV